ncbi:hypothetical protein NBRC116583_34390 [Arenicella sp. 4NH20-0111]|uniref:toprim domain-containing protein n=1 Tax=Arenicella sp. 4NH20-0111 TaxID=3127648 RepID=UPI0031058447
MFSGVTPLNIKVAGYSPALHQSSTNGRESADELRPADDLYAYVEHAFNHYEEVLVSTPRIWDWFKARKIDLTHPLISEFRLGFSDRSLCKNYGRDKGRQSDLVRGAWQRLGILKPSGYQYFHGDVVFPFFDGDDRIVGAYGRRVTPENRCDQIYHHHWFHGEATFFNRRVLEQYSQIVLCKSPLEALVLISAGISNVVSIMGLFSFGLAHMEELYKYQPSEIVLAFDNSDSGNHVAGMLAQSLSAMSLKCYRLNLPRNQDIGEVAQREDDLYEAFSKRLKTALPFDQSYENRLGEV